MGASPRLHRRTPTLGRALVVATTVLALLGASCAERDPEDSVSSPVATDHWAATEDAALQRLDDAIGRILSAVERNDVRLMGAGPQDCATEAGSLASAAGEAGAVADRARLDWLSALCAWLQGPADAQDVDGVVRTLDPLLTAVGRIAPLLERPDQLS